MIRFERQFAVIIAQFREAAAVGSAEVRGGRIVAGTACGGGRGCAIGIVAALGGAIGCAAGRLAVSTGGVAEKNVVCHDLCRHPTITIPIRVVTHLQAAFHQHHTAFGKVAGDKLRCIAPGHDVDKVCILGIGVFALVTPIHSQAIGCHRRPLLSVAQFGICYQPTLQKYLVKH